MRLHHWLISLKHRRRVAVGSRRRKSYRHVAAGTAVFSSESLEARLLLTTPPPVDPVEEAQDDANAAQTDLDNANNTRDSEMTGIQSQFDSDSLTDSSTFDTSMQGIEATLDSDAAAGDATKDAGNEST